MISAKGRVYGLMAYPVEHSLSPAMQNFYGEAMSVDMAYVPFCVEPERLEEAVAGAYALNVQGMNVTVPHKQQVMAYLKGVDPAARAIGAVNTLVRTDGGFYGYNTDGIGLLRAMKQAGISPKGRDCLILGSGGASKAAAWVLGQEKAASVTILNRSVEKAERLAEEMNELFGRNRMKAMALSDYEKLSGHSYLAVQTTSVGMYPHGDEAPIEDPAFYEKLSEAVDVIYTPSETRFMKLAKEAGARAINGLDMLLYQGVAAFELWNPGLKVPDSVIAESRRRLLSMLFQREAKHIILIGFMGAGKTTVGKALSQLTGKPLVDTDKLIEERAGMSISRIFETRGEEAFRKLETEILQELSKKLEPLVISVGGGLPLREENRKLLEQMGQRIYLRVRPDTVLQRLSGDTKRPLLQGEHVKERVEELLNQRNPIYEAAASGILDVDGSTPKETAEKIVRLAAGGR